MRLLEDGQIIRDTYEVERFLGEGAFAEVYRVRHRFLGRQAMKVFKRVGISIEDINDMLGEAIMLSRIGHPNIVRVFDANVFETELGSCGYFTMENISGGSLDKFWRSYGGSMVPLDIAVDLMKQVCRGIAQAHREKPPIIHRDIKPQNILVGYEADGLRARVSDFGLAKKVNPLTLLATAAGTLAFKPPEVFSQHKADSCAADVWALGATLYVMLTDRLPYAVPHDATWHTPNLFDAPFVPPSEIRPDVNRTLDRIVRKSLQKDPRDRYQTARELLDALENLQTPEEPVADAGSAVLSSASKTVLGNGSSLCDSTAEALVTGAFKARQEGRLAEAADLLEEAFNKSQALRAKYANQVKLWRCGISM